MLLGHYIAASMFNRAGLSPMRAVYEFIRDSYFIPVRLWPSCRYECWIMGSILTILSSDLTRCWASEVAASDASTSSFGFCVAHFDPATVAQCGGWQEMEISKTGPTRMGSPLKS